jgi:PAS domain S-box-containing protein
MAHLHQVFWVGDTTDRAVRYVSPYYEVVWGRSCQSLIDDVATLVDSIHPDDRERMDGAIAGKRATEGYDEEFRILRPSGEVRWIWARSYPVTDETGEVTRFAAIAEDITERKAAEEEAARLVAIIEYSNDSVVSITPDGIIVGWNNGATKQYGYSTEEIIGCSLSRLFPPGHDSEFQRILAQLRRGETVAAYDAIRLHKDGTRVTVSIAIVPIQTRSAEVSSGSSVSPDIIRIKLLEAQVIQAQRMEAIGTLAIGVAHDFNNLLAVIMGYAEILVGNIDKDDPARRAAEEIRRVVVRGTGLTRQLLLLGRKQLVRPVVLDLTRSVSAMASLLNGLVGEDVTLKLVAEPTAASVEADAGYLGQLLMNLVVNARQAMPAGGDVTVSTQVVTMTGAEPEVPADVPPGEYVKLSVSDTGIGMSDEVKAHIFEEFFTTKTAGTGLGLATCQKIVRQSGAYMTVASELGKGTTFEILFPRVADIIERPAGPPNGMAAPARGAGLLLVVEDEPAVRALACTLLESLGYEVLRASNGQEALRVVLDHVGPPIRLVFTDVAMPLMKGPEMAPFGAAAV